MSMSTTEINNQTAFPLKVQVGNSVYKSDLTIVEAGGKYVIGVDVNGTYREFVMGVNNNSMKNLMISSDDLCDNKSITIKEEDGELQVHKESRRESEAFSSTSTTTSSTSNSTLLDKMCNWIRVQTQKLTSRITRS